ncbi:hypothetical protein SteCoe_19240 [Stentor coeruleus]|uniref:Uncharacterized protein n=1 Tax=Stentor coeruleus TaxID=5963 RepID=A0A1R2BUX1_9CILI|nr:hypothetical protein SteCoe_19240 [Stentor coeruleus]
MKIQLLKTEGNWIESCLGCYILVNNNLIDVITPLNSIHDTNIFEIPSNGLLRMILKDMGNTEGYVASLSLQISSLPSLSGRWLPLFNNLSNDFLPNIIENIKSPRIILLLYSDVSDDEIFLTNIEVQRENLSEIVLSSEISLTKENDQELITTSHFNMLLDSIDQKKHQDTVEVLTKELESYQELLLREKEANKSLREKIDNLLESLKNQGQRSSMRENSLIQLISDKEKEICTILEMNRSLKQNNRKLEMDNNNLLEQCERLNFTLESMQGIEKQCKQYQQQLKNAEINSEKLVNTVMELSKVACIEYFDIENILQSEESDRDLKNLVEDQEDKIINKESDASPLIIDKDNNKEKGFLALVEEQVTEFIENIIGKVVEIEKMIKIDEFTVKINEIDVEFAVAREGVWIRSGQKLVNHEEYWQRQKKTKSEITLLSGNSVYSVDYNFENVNKKNMQRISNKKLILKPLNTLNKYKTALTKPLIKDIKSIDIKKTHK